MDEEGCSGDSAGGWSVMRRIDLRSDVDSGKVGNSKRVGW